MPLWSCNVVGCPASMYRVLKQALVQRVSFMLCWPFFWSDRAPASPESSPGTGVLPGFHLDRVEQQRCIAIWSALFPYEGEVVDTIAIRLRQTTFVEIANIINRKSYPRPVLTTTHKTANHHQPLSTPPPCPPPPPTPSYASNPGVNAPIHPPPPLPSRPPSPASKPSALAPVPRRPLRPYQQPPQPLPP